VRDLHGGGFHREKPGYDPRDPRVCPADCGPHHQPAGMERFPIRVRHARQREPAMRRSIGSVVARRSTALPAMGSPNPPCDRNRGVEAFPFWHRDGYHGHTRCLRLFTVGLSQVWSSALLPSMPSGLARQRQGSDWRDGDEGEGRSPSATAFSGMMSSRTAAGLIPSSRAMRSRRDKPSSLKRNDVGCLRGGGVCGGSLPPV